MASLPAAQEHSGRGLAVLGLFHLLEGHLAVSGTCHLWLDTHIALWPWPRSSELQLPWASPA